MGYLLLDVRASGEGVLRPVRAGSMGPAADVIARDFPAQTLPDGIGLDGQQFYAIARDPLHPAEVASSLDNPQYRYQRVLYPLLAWLVHPSGGGAGMVWALVIVGLVGLFVGGAALGALSGLLRGPPWLGMLFPLLPGAVWALTTGVADGLAAGLVLVAIVAALKNRQGIAIAAAVAAVLTRETTILVPLAFVLARRRRDDLPLLVVPAVALAVWMVVVRIVVPGGGVPPEHLVLPFSGLLDAIRGRWLHGHELIGMASTLSALFLGGFVIVARRGPVELRWVVGLQLAFLAVCSGDVLGNDFGSTRATLVALTVALALLMARNSELTQEPGYLESTGARNLPV